MSLHAAKYLKPRHSFSARRSRSGFTRELAAHLGRVLVGIETSEQMHDMVREFHDGFNPGGL